MENAAELRDGGRIKLGLFLLGSFTIAYLGAQFLHEICHSGAAVLVGGSTGGISIHPFSWSYSYCYSSYPMFDIAAGAIGSSLIAVLLYAVVIRWIRPWLLPLLLVGPVSLFENGGYWLIDTLIGSNGDACRLINMGIPISVIFCISAVLLLSGIFLTIHLTRTIGITDESFRNRLVILGLGIFPYILAELLWNWFYARYEFRMWLDYGLFTVAITISLSILLGFFPSRKPSRVSLPTWPIVAGFNIAAIALVVGLLWINSASKAASSHSQFKSSTVRPDNAPEILLPHTLAIEPVYITAPPLKGVENSETYNLSYELPENTDPNEVLDYLVQLHKKQGYAALVYSLSDPNEFHDPAWKEESMRFGLKTCRSKSCQQGWVRLVPKPSYSVFAISTLQKDHVTTVHVFSLASYAVSTENILRYAEIHPGTFDPNQIEQFRQRNALSENGH